jgi:hypothetical protein
MRRLRLSGIVFALFFLGACGQDVVIDVPASAQPYAGSLASPTPITDDPDVFARAGAAAPALECVGAPSNGGSPDIVTDGASPTEAIEEWIEGEGSWFGGLPPHGYRLERQDQDRVLFSLETDGARKVTVIVREGDSDDEGGSGWAVESWAMCDPSEFPGALTEEMDIPIWTDDQGARVDTRRVSSYQGAEHCEWQDITFLSLGEPPEERQFVRDTRGDFELSGAFGAETILPPDAADTTWEYAGRHLWLSDDELTAYLVSVEDANDVEAWPRATEPIYCR